VHQNKSKTGVLTIDGSVEEKPHSDENDIVYWHYDHSKDCNLKAINLQMARMTALRQRSIDLLHTV